MDNLLQTIDCYISPFFSVLVLIPLVMIIQAVHIKLVAILLLYESSVSYHRNHQFHLHTA